MVTAMKQRANTPARRRAALHRAQAEGVQVRQLTGCGMWVATSAVDAHVAYEVTPWSCDCHAGQFGDPVCKHRSALLEQLGCLILEPEPDLTTPESIMQSIARCEDCRGGGRTTVMVEEVKYGSSYPNGWNMPPVRVEYTTGRMVARYFECDMCRGTGQVAASVAA